MRKKIGIWGTVRQGPNDGYGYVGLKLTQTFSRHGVDCYWEDETAPIALSFCQPPQYGGTKEQYRVAYTPWESTVLPEHWIPMMLDMDQVWTTSKWCRNVFEKNGLKNVQYFPHGLDRKDFSLVLRNPNPENFIFLHMGEPADRKNGQLAFDAFKKAFGPRQNVWLIFKTATWVEARWKDPDGSIIGPVNQFPNVEIIDGILPVQELNKLFHKSHCLLYPSSGEGFGMIPFEALATGLPSIFPDYSGMSEYSKYGIKLKYTISNSLHDFHEGQWCWPDIDDLVSQMIDVYDNYERYLKETYENAIQLRKEFSWDKIVDDMLTALEPHW